MRQCELDGCDRPLRARGLCEMHYQKEKRAGLGELQRAKPRRAEGVELLAQKGENRCCVDCGDRPWGGGMRCLPCFQRRCKERQEQLERLAAS
jgi:hypothetical protein